MLILALDTATDQGSLALTEDGLLLGEASLESQGAYLVKLLPGVEALLAAAGRRLADLDALAVSLGPGNFTGLRIGQATAKALAWALKRPLVPVPTLEVLAARFSRHPGPIGVVLDAKRNEVFWGVFSCPGDWPQVVESPQRLPLADLPARLKPPLTLTGPGLNAYRDFWTEAVPPGVALAPPEARHPRAAIVARLAGHYLAEGVPLKPAAQLVPLYLRPAL